ncbi:DNA polymerase III subunit gamma/tau [Phytohalomonas tamaricis]|uniref:DNA polymerase III subunit gamma/tau n=1 Tax=Phytohalomonas tamaricis TaxID=2081032 RepID=UPI000D0B52CC|nr:DNA polymerase III subunit gamma/tau [Phytohalomonas tamaricis]
MSYQVLARKWRPRTFHELVGQEHVQRALVNALDQGRLHHAYLFTGTRGVGKTTLARILAKCLNCENGVTSKPCGQCETCRAIDEGRFVDLIEVDAASRTKVEDTRELLDNVQYAPTQGRYKVYLIDEVHMLSTHSFNALLKTLEEPPPHVKFLLATTDPQKLPVTVLSRCLQFSLKHMPPERVVEHLTRVLSAEDVPFDERALWLLGKAANGSMRDALSLTDQAIAFGQGEVQGDDVAAMLGTLDHRHLLALTEALAESDAARVLSEVASLAEQGPDFSGVLDELGGVFHRLAIAQMVPDALDNSHGDQRDLLALAQRFTAEDVQLYYQIALQGRGDMEYAPEPRTALEMTLLRMLAFRPQGVPKPAQTPLPMRGDASARPQQGTRESQENGATTRSKDAGDEDAVPAPVSASPGSPVRETSESEHFHENRDYPAMSGASYDDHDGDHEAATAQAWADQKTVAADPLPAAFTVRDDVSSIEDVPPWDDESVPLQGNYEDVHKAVEAPKDISAESMPVHEQHGADTYSEQWQAEKITDTGTIAVSADAAAPTAPVAPMPPSSSVQGEITHAQWLELFPQLGLSGMTGNLVAHCIVSHDDGSTLKLILDPSQGAMNSDIHRERLEAALSDAGCARRVAIEEGAIPEDWETPKSRRDRELAERHRRAVEALRHDPHIKEIEQHFAARLLEQSVTSFEQER